MAYGIVTTIAASAHNEYSLSGIAGGTPKNSVKILNPNDGVIYVARDRDCLGTDLGAWDWKIPSQSYGQLPGPFQSIGLYYLDQSGAGLQGEISIYASDQKLGDPLFIAIGRALSARSTTLDITQGAQPANPGVGIDRLWADTTDILHLLNPNGIDRTFLDSVQTWGGVLAGHGMSPAFANPALTPFTPTVQQTNAITTTIEYAAYQKIGRGVYGRMDLKFGSAGVANVAMQVNPGTLPTPVTTGTNGSVVGSALYAKTGGAGAFFCAAFFDFGAFFFEAFQSTGGSWLGQFPNFAIASGDTLSFAFHYEAAS